MVKEWQQWGKRPQEAENFVDRATGDLPLMESTKQLVKLVSDEYQKGQKILDVGCNVGHYLVGLRNLDSQLNYTGVDAYEHYINQAQKIFANDSNSNFHVKSIFDPIFPDDPRDIVFCCNVILHLPDFRTPVENLLSSTKKVCFIRTLLGDHTTVVKSTRVSDNIGEIEKFDEEGNPEDFIYQNTWNKKYFTNYIEKLGWKTEIIPDEYDPSVFQKEDDLKKGFGTKIFDGKQAYGNIIFNWAWVKITPDI